MKVYLSPSSQNKNAYATGNTVESAQCQKIAQAAKKYLQSAGYEVKVGSENSTISQRVSESNSWDADLHVPIHTNAGGGDGTLVMCYTGNTGNKYVKNIYNQVAALSPGKDDGIKVNTSLAEITGTKAICVYVECEFHDNSTLAKWITENTDALGKAIAEGICKADGKTLNSDTWTDNTDTHEVVGYYKVQAGAFSEKANAENLVKQLKAKGFDAYAFQSGNLYKVQCGAFKDESNADALGAKLGAAGFSAYVYYDE